MLDLTICSVSFNAQDYLRLNHKLTLPQDTRWFVVKNTRKEPEITFCESIFGIDNVTDPKMPTEFPGQAGKGSFHHALALNKAIESGHLNTRFVLFIDPDFYIIPSLTSCIQHMLEQDLTFFGAPYLLEHDKIRIQNFPVAFCMFVDTSKVDLRDFDFLPNHSGKILADTGYNVYKQYKEDGRFQYDCVLPQAPDYKTDHPCTNLDLKSLYGLVPNIPMDQYYWRNKLFGIHVHMKLHLRTPDEMMQRANIQTKEIKKIVKVVRSYDQII
jgi:hypothetical protein